MPTARATPGILVPSGNLITPGGYPGVPGANAWTLTDEQFTVPAIGTTADVDVEDARWIAIGEFVWLAGAGVGGDAALFQVTALSGNTVTLLTPASSKAVPTTVVPIGALLTPAGGPGPIEVSSDVNNIATLGSDGLVYVPGQKELELDLDLYVPLTNPGGTPQTRFATIQDAWNSLKWTAIPVGRIATIHVAAGIFDLGTGLDLFHANSDRIYIIGEPPVQLPLAAAVSGWTVSTVGAYQYTITPQDASQVQIDDVLSVMASGNTIYDGAHKVIAKAGNTLTLLHTGTRNLAGMAGGVNFANSKILWFPTRLRTSSRLARSSIIIGNPGLGVLKNCSILDTWSAGPMGQGLYSTITVDRNPSTVYLENLALCQCDLRALFVNNTGVKVFTHNFYVGDSKQNGIDIYNGSGLATDGDFVVGTSANRGVNIFAASAELNGIEVVTSFNEGVAAVSGSNVIIQRSTTSPQNNYVQHNNINLYSYANSFLRSTIGIYTLEVGAGAIGIRTNVSSVVFLSGDAGPSNYTTASPPVNTVGNNQSIIIV